MSTEKVPIGFTVAYLLTLLFVSLFSTACFLKFALAIFFSGNKVDLRHAQFYVYGGVMYFILSLIFTVHISRCVVDRTLQQLVKIRELEVEEQKLIKLAIIEVD